MAPRSNRPMAWDPKSPATLLLPTLDPETNELRVDTFLSHDGVGCNPHERSTLMKLITSHGDYHESGEENVKALSRTYRSALRECLVGWEGDEAIDDEESLELLKLVYAVTHLSEIFLLMSPTNDGVENEDSWSMPGAATADTVRYLRLHHMADPYAVVGEGLDDMLQSSQPEQYGAIYWKLLQTLVLRGCLDDAWALISRHYLCRRCFENTEILDEFHAITIEEDREGFLALRSLLLSAPLPGGRSEWNDAGLDDDENDGDEDNVLLMDGVQRDAYKLWDSSLYSSDRDCPLSFDTHAAISIHKAWKREVIDNASLRGLLCRIPQLQANVILILSGRFDTVVFDSWSEALCAELLYQRPGLCPSDLHVRTATAMQKLGASVNTGFDEVILSVMKGDAGRAVEVLHQLGGGSGAALPATMTALLCSLLTDAEQIPPLNSSSFNIQTELLLSASQALLSSLSSSEPDVGVRLSTKLLLPYAKPTGDIRITATLGETLVRHGPTTDAEARVLLDLCRDLVARKSRRVLDGCVSLILFRHHHYLAEQRFGGSAHWLLKGIELEVLLYATNDGRRDNKAWQTVVASGVCSTLLCSSCATTSQSLLAGLVANDKMTSVGQAYIRAREMVTSIQDDDPSGLAHTIPEVKLLILIFEMARAIVDNEGDNVVAKNIVACLEEKIDDQDDGVVFPLAHPSMHWDLLSLAHSILQSEEDCEQSSPIDEKYKASFDVQGIRTLLEILTQITIGSSKGGITESRSSDVISMRLAFGKGLMRAIVAANAKRQEINRRSQTHGQLGLAHSSKLSAYSRSDQERIVEMMLDPSM